MEDISETPPKDINPYSTLNLTPSASAAEVRTAYKKLALKHHPDKAEASQKSTAHNTFQNIAFAYAILSSPHRRTLYDTTGSTSETLSSLSDDDDFNWLSFFRAQYSAISASTFSDFSASYKRSAEERKDLLAAYSQYEGRMNKVYEVVMLSNPIDDEERFRGIIDEAIEKREAEGYKAYVKEPQHSITARMKKARREAEYAEQQKRANARYKSIFGGDGKGASEIDGSAVDAGDGDADLEGGEPLTNREKKSMRGYGDLGDLAAMIQSRNKARGETFLDSLEAKYAGASTSGKGTKRKAEEEPDEEAFQKTRVKLAQAKDDCQEKAKPNGQAGNRAKAASRGRNAKAAVVKEDFKEDDDDADEDIDLENESEDDKDGVVSEDESEEEEVKPKAKPKTQAKAQKGRAKKATAPAAKRNTRSRVKH
ncbi:MAG: hypothetical protein Q9224_000135 [Gallowayella concinna]